MVSLLQIYTFFTELSKVFDFSKVFDCLSRELLIAKQNAFGFDKNTLKLVNTFLANRNQRVKQMANIDYAVKYYLGFHKVQS